MISSTVGGSAGYSRPLLRGGRQRGSPASSPASDAARRHRALLRGSWEPPHRTADSCRCPTAHRRGRSGSPHRPALGSSLCGAVAQSATATRGRQPGRA
jgi:hypothetical protein